MGSSYKQDQQEGSAEKKLVAKPDNPSLILGIPHKEGTDSHKLSSVLHMNVVHTLHK